MVCRDLLRYEHRKHNVELINYIYIEGVTSNVMLPSTVHRYPCIQPDVTCMICFLLYSYPCHPCLVYLPTHAPTLMIQNADKDLDSPG